MVGVGGGWFCVLSSLDDYLLQSFCGGWSPVGADAGLIASRFYCVFICLLPVDPGFPVI